MPEEMELSILLRLKDQASKQFKETTAAIEKASKGLKVLGGAMLGVGAGGLAIVQQNAQLKASLEITGRQLGLNRDEMVKLANATSDASFPLESVQRTFDLLVRSGVRDADMLQESAKAFDALADATGGEASQMADLLIPAFKAFKRDLPRTAKDLDAFTWLSRNTTIGVEEFGRAMTYLAPDMDRLNVSMEDAVAILAVLESRGISGAAGTRELRRAVTEAVESGRSLNGVLGISRTELDQYRDKMAAAAGITDELADVAGHGFTLLDKFKQGLREASLSASGFLEPLQPLLAGLSSMGTALIALGPTSKAIKEVVSGFGAIKLAAISTYVALAPYLVALAAIGAVVYGSIKAGEAAAGRLSDIEARVKAGEISEDEAARLWSAELAPNIEGFATGGVVGGPVGQPRLAVVHGGETVTPPGRGLGNITIQVSSAAFMGTEGEARAWARKIVEYIRSDNRMRAFGRAA